ncbi:phosphatidylinositol mannoside acyltransferase [Cellulomonas fimi]|uniref:Phosphatidylinositol mannoside acyltransferase n=1 Tax=Cellulomonas fimi TaxID=1708 RepID=A0A7Y0LYB7_CELFI|nr:phosphatidylinositol mannoside acyltransferase [Cellulomonas fimi]NMR20119.1 phosphatidylinositol mannoside acyltransferase [Cellulomonas fimi]
MNVGRAFALAWRLGGRIPEPVLRLAATVGADVAWWRRGGGVRQLERNLARLRPDASPRELRRLSRAGMRSYLRYYREAFALSGYSPEQLAARVRVIGGEAVRDRIQAGGTVPVALGHMGNWDLAGAYATVHLGPITTVAERLEPAELFQEFLRFREGLGMRIIPLDGSGGEVFRKLLRVARGGTSLMPLVADRDLTARGVEVDLAGERARVAAGPAAVAITTGEPLVPASIRYERLRGPRRRAAGSPWGILIEFHPPIEVPLHLPREDQLTALTQAWVAVVGGAIARYPQDWHMLQKVFVADLDPARYARSLAQDGGS